ncbi:MAG: alpha-L-rhamnosidase N-terminal domain-containing protein [Prevotella sp.]|nr:alpha-L-rhamnosidase N-terminal domain-containing protein [Prevotella sp.]
MKSIFHKFLIFLLLSISAGVMNAKDRYFICHPTAEKGEEVWFHSILPINKLPDSASISISTTGFVLVYVNGRNATTATLWPYRPNNMQGVASQDIDITCLLSYGRNVISIWYAPCLQPFHPSSSFLGNTFTASSQGYHIGDYQISVCITTVTEGKEQRFCNTERDWLCSIAAGKMTRKGEDYDAMAYQQDWKSFIYAVTPLWIGAEKSMLSHPILNDIPDIPLRARKIFEPISVYESNDTIRCYFPLGAEGQIRLTIRGARKGQEIDVNGMRYRCIGKMDEQFFTRFTTVKTDSIIITSRDGTKLPELADAEIIMLKPDESARIGF